MGLHPIHLGVQSVSFDTVLWTPLDGAFNEYHNPNISVSESSGLVDNVPNILDPGTNDYTQSVTLNKPSFTAAGVNGKDTVTFDGNNRHFQIPALTGTYSYFLVQSSPTSRSRHTFWGNFSGKACVTTFNGNTGGAYIGVGSPTTRINGSSVVLTNADIAYDNLILDKPVASSFIGITIDGIDEFGEWGSGGDFGGQFCASVGKVGSFTTDEMERLEGWAAWEYDFVADLTFDHPYKSAPPTV